MAIDTSIYELIKNPPSVENRTIKPIIITTNNNGAGGPTAPVVIPYTQDYNFYVKGVFGGVEVSLEWSLDDLTYIAFEINGSPIKLTKQSFQYFFRLDAGIYVRAEFTNAVGGTSVSAELR